MKKIYRIFNMNGHQKNNANSYKNRYKKGKEIVKPYLLQ